MDIEQFSEKYSVKVKRDGCGDQIIVGKAGHIGDGYKEGSLGVYIDAEAPKAWTYAKRKLLAAGMQLKQDGDIDGVLLFDPRNRTQARLAFKVAAIFSKRRAVAPTPAQLAARTAFADRQRNALKPS